MFNGGSSMDDNAMFLDCPEYVNDERTVRCGLPAEVVYRYAVASTDGPLDSAKILCPRQHWFNGPIESLSVATGRDAAIHQGQGAHSR